MTAPPTSSINIEDLPTEMQTEILLHVPDISSLKNLVHASPIFHGAYRAHPASILETVLEHEIKLYRLDALAVIKASCIERNATEKYKISVEAFCREGHSSENNEILNLDEILALVRLHRVHRVVSFATKAFCAKTLPNPVTGASLNCYAALSPYEDARIRRAFYRYQTYCILASTSTQPLFSSDFLENPRPHRPELDELFRAFNAGRLLENFPAWEVEEIVCIHDFLVQYYADLFKIYQNELGMHSPKWQNVPPRRISDRLLSPTGYAQSCLRHGLYFLKHMTISSPSTQIQILAKHLTESYHLAMVLEPHADAQCPEAEGGDGYTPFEWRYNEYERTGCDLTEPTLGWWIAGDIGGNESTYRQPGPGRRYLRYVFWDEWRLREWGLVGKAEAPKRRSMKTMLMRVLRGRKR
ncbi:MAG: hypothetical protein L6R38_004998 [Xanthoria sp. 2 TBL-2021]|nr:MAG: hypothetical protein L6R38_004998 [Xanthoria sp. 2 TBL-2021]